MVSLYSYWRRRRASAPDPPSGWQYVRSVARREYKPFRAVVMLDGDAPTTRAVPGLSLRMNAIALMGNVILSSALGYPFWLLAAQRLDASAVGIGAGAVSGTRLCAELAMFGLNAAIIRLLPLQGVRAARFLSLVFSLLCLTTLLVSGGFLLLMSSALFNDLDVLVTNPYYGISFVFLCLLWTLSAALDAVLIALHRSDRLVLRSLVQGLAQLAVLWIASRSTQIDDTQAILLGSIAGMFASFVPGYIYLRVLLPNFRYHLIPRWGSTRALLGVGLPNHWLSLALATPIWTLPIVAAEILTPAASAYWYTVWMFGFLVLITPSATARALFAVASHAGEHVARHLRQGIRLSFFIGIPTALGMIVFAHPLLAIMGEQYADAGATPLRIVVLGVIPRTFIEMYVAIRRATHRLQEPTIIAGGSSVLAIIGAAFGASIAGLSGLALGWLIVQWCASGWALWRICGVLRQRGVSVDGELAPPQVGVANSPSVSD